MCPPIRSRESLAKNFWKMGDLYFQICGIKIDHFWSLNWPLEGQHGGSESKNHPKSGENRDRKVKADLARRHPNLGSPSFWKGLENARFWTLGSQNTHPKLFSGRPSLYTWGTGFQGTTLVLRWLKNVKKWSKNGQNSHFWAFLTPFWPPFWPIFRFAGATLTL